LNLKVKVDDSRPVNKVKELFKEEFVASNFNEFVIDLVEL
jgi:hypothetical protein